MSSTGRGVERQSADRYVTPYMLAAAITRRCLEPHSLIHQGFKGHVLEPSAGTGQFVKAVRNYFPRETKITAIDIGCEKRESLVRAGANVVLKKDFLEIDERDLVHGRPDLIPGNPPFNEAEEHVRHGCRLLSLQGHLAFLLRINFLGSLERIDFWKKYPPSHIWPLTPRPYFLDYQHNRILDKHGKRSTDATEYAVFVWSKSQLLTAPSYRHTARTNIFPLLWREETESVTWRLGKKSKTVWDGAW